MENKKLDKDALAYEKAKIRLSFCTKDRFNQIFNIYPKGNPENAFTIMKFHVSAELTWDMKHVTVDLIEKKWSEYIKKVFSDGTSEKYIKSLESFIKNKDYNINFNPSSGKGSSFLDKYK